MDTSEKYLKICESAKEVQRKWSCENGDYVFDPFDGEASVWFWYHSKDVSEFIWLPRHDQLEEICIEFFMQIMRISRFEAYLKFLEWYSRCLRDAFEHGLKNSNYGFIDSSEELMLECAMNMLHGKKWDGKKWVKSIEGYKA